MSFFFAARRIRDRVVNRPAQPVAPPPPQRPRRGLDERAIRIGTNRPSQTGFGGRRATLQDALDRVRSFQGGGAPPPDGLDRWRALDLDVNAMAKLQPSALMELLAEVSPDISRALWDFIRMCNPGWDAHVVSIKGERVGGDPQAMLDSFIAKLKAEYGSFDVIIGRLYTGAFLRGGFMAELVVNRRGVVPLDIATPDPASARFRKRDDPDRGKVWQLGQWQNGEWVDIKAETVRYIPIDPPPGSPYGRPLAMPALFTAVFTIGLLHDIRRVVAQQGYPRLDISVDLEEIVKAMPPDIADDPDLFKAFIDETLFEVVAMYESLQPEDAYVHTSAIKVNKPVGAIDSSSLGAVDGLIRALERMTIRALKTMPLLMGSNEGTSETHANRQWEVYAAGVKALQHLAESILEHMLSLAMQAQGVAVTVEFRFAELRASEMLRDAQVEQLRIKNAIDKWLMGWITQDQAAMEVTGHGADQDGPRFLASNLTSQTVSVPNVMAINPDPGSSRSSRMSTANHNRQRRELFLQQWTRRLYADQPNGTNTRTPQPTDPSWDALRQAGWTPRQLTALVRLLEGLDDGVDTTLPGVETILDDDGIPMPNVPIPPPPPDVPSLLETDHLHSRERTNGHHPTLDGVI